MQTYYVTASADDGHIYSSSGFENSDSWIYFGYDDGTNRNHMFHRFSNVDIPKDAVIDEAYIDNYAYCTGTIGTINGRIYACAEDDSAACTSYSNYNAKSLTTAYVNWDLVFTDTDLHVYQSGDIKTVIQEIVNRAGWVSGNHLQIMVKDIGTGSTQCQFDSFDDGSTSINAMFLDVTWHKAANVTTPAITSITNSCPLPAMTGKVNIPIPSNINITNSCPLPAITGKANVVVSNVANVNVTMPSPDVNYVGLVISPTINTSVGMPSSINNVVSNVIDLRCRMYEPVVEICVYPPIYVPPVVIDNSYLYESRYETFKYELLTLQGGVYKSSNFITNYVENADITIDFTRDIIGTANINIKNNEDINYLTDLIRPWYVLNDLYSFPMGTFMLMNPKKQSNGILVERPIQCYDLTLALDQDKTLVSTSFAAGSNVVDLIETLLISVGTWVKYNIVDSTSVLAENVCYELGKSKLFIINSLLNMINYYPIWCDGNGVFRGIPWSESANITHDFIDNEFSLYESGIELDLNYAEMYNRVVIINNQLNEDTAPLYKVWTFEDEGLSLHPFSYTSIGRYVTKIFNSEAVSQSYVDLRARREMLKMLEIEESVNYNNVFVSSRIEDGLPWQGDGYRFKNTLLNVDSIYKIESLSIPLLAGGLVSSKIKRVRSTY